MRPTELWAITSYFNPAGFSSRRQNFRRFRDALKVPLLVVEMRADGMPATIADDEADRVVRVHGEPFMWQKERLLNLALDHLPPHVRDVAWLDSDVVFGRADWAEATQDLLRRHGGLVQPFSVIHHLGSHMIRGDGSDWVASVLGSQQSFGRAHSRRLFDGLTDLEAFFETNVRLIGRQPYGMAGISTTRPAPGFAWAARRADLETIPLPEFNVLGGGDSLLAYAAIGRSDLRRFDEHASPAHADWMRRYVHQVSSHYAGAVRHVEGDLYHLWHGSIEDRRYEERKFVLRDLGFDPHVHLIAHPGQPLRWSTAGADLRRHVMDYFLGRNEDAVTG